MRLSARRVFPSVLFLLFLSLFARGAVSAVEESAASPADPSTAVVKIYVAAVLPDAMAPWKQGFSFDKTGSGAIISGRRVLTNAHVVMGHTFVQVRLHGHPEKHSARVTFVSHVADLALVELEEPAHLDPIEPLALGDLPDVRDQVSAFGFPTGGDTLSITSGVVTRVEHVTYVQSWERLLAIQMDAAIDWGSSGGPLIHDGRLVGVAAQSSGTNDTIGHAVAGPVVRQFLDDVADGRVDGVPTLRLRTGKLQNPALKASLDVPEGETGVIVKTVAASSPAAGLLRPGDVLTEVDGLDVADDGTVEFRARERTDLLYGIDRHQVGETVTLRFLRDGARHEAEIVLGVTHGESELFPRLYEQPGDYYIFGGLAFLALTRDYILRAHQIESFDNQLVRYLQNEPEHPGQQVVLLGNVLTAAVNEGYGDDAGAVIQSVDGQPVRNLRELVALVEEGDDPYVTFEYRRGGRITLDRQAARQATPGLLQRHRISSDRSASLEQPAEASPSSPGPSRAAPTGSPVASLRGSEVSDAR